MQHEDRDQHQRNRQIERVGGQRWRGRPGLEPAGNRGLSRDALNRESVLPFARLRKWERGGVQKFVLRLGPAGCRQYFRSAGEPNGNLRIQDRCERSARSTTSAFRASASAGIESRGRRRRAGRPAWPTAPASPMRARFRWRARERSASRGKASARDPRRAAGSRQEATNPALACWRTRMR